MGTISIIKQSELMSAVNGKFKTYLLLYLGLPFLIIACLFGVIVGENAFIKTISLFGAIFFGVGCYVFLRGEQEYKPGKSFPFLRHSKEKIRVLTLYIGIAAIVMLILFFVLSLLSSSNSLSLSIRLLLGIPVFLGLIYYTNKSCQVHEDVDFATCAEMESIIGVENYEKIQATYQNFDILSENELEDGCNMIMVTDKKIYFAFYESGHWSYVNKRIDEISRLGSMGTEDKYFFKLDFHDSTSIILHMNTMGETTNNSTFFLRKFLEVLDAVALGTVDAKISSRRRISVNTKPSNQNEELITEGRKLDINSSVINGLRNASPVEPGRVLEF